MTAVRTFADICSLQEILMNKFPDEHFPALVSPRNTSDPHLKLSSEALFAQRHRMCSEFFDYLCLCHHVMFSKDLRIFLSASTNSYRGHVSQAFVDGNLSGYKLFLDGKYAAAKRAFLNACERFKSDSDPHASAVSAMYAVEALAMQRYWSDVMEAIEFCLPIFKAYADIYGIIKALCHLGRACMFLGDTNTAKTCYLDASAVVAKYNAKDLHLVVCKHLADFHHRMGDCEQSIVLMKKEVLSFRSTTDVILQLDFQVFLSQLLLQYGAFDEAFDLSQEISKQLQALPSDILQGNNPGRNRVWIDDRLLGSALLIQSKYYLIHRDIDSAEALAKKALSISRSDNSVGISCWVVLGKCDLFKSACNDAFKTFLAASHYPSFAFCEAALKAQVYKGLILSEFLCGHQEKALSCLPTLRDTALSSFYRLTHSRSLRTEAVIAHCVGNFETAQLALEKCLALVGSDYSDFSVRMESCKVRLLFSEVYRMTGNYGLSLKYLTETKTILESHKHVDFLLRCQMLRSFGELELLRSKVGEGIRLLEQALDLVQNTCFTYDTIMCLGTLAIGHAMVGDFIRSNERHKRMNSLASGIVNSVSQVYETVVSNVVSRLKALSASTNATTFFTVKAREDDRSLSLVTSCEQITIYDGLLPQKQKDLKKHKKQPIAIVSHRLDDSVLLAPSLGNTKGIVLQGRSSTPMFVFKAEDAAARFTILQLISCLVSNNRPSPYLTTISFTECETSEPTHSACGASSDPIEISLIPRSLKGNIVPVRISHLDCQLLDQVGSIAGIAILCSDPLESGAYPIRIRASKQGKMFLHVNLIGHPVVGSPLEINVSRSFPSPMYSCASFYRTAVQNETNLFAFHLCDHSGSPIDVSKQDGSDFRFQFRYVNRTAIALELAEVEVKRLASSANSLLVSAAFPHPGDLVLYVDFCREGFAPTSISIRCISSSIIDLLSIGSYDEANILLAASNVKNNHQLNISLLKSTECRQCFEVYLSFRKVLSAFVRFFHGELARWSDSPLQLLIPFNRGAS
jgi:tetratricopeptide (TPR) repeat protein